MNGFLEKIKTTRLLAGVGIICMFLGTIIAYAKINFWGYTGNVCLYKHLEGIVIMIVAIVDFLFIFKDTVEKYIPKLFESKIGKNITEVGDRKLSLISVIIVVIMAVILHARLDFSIAHFSLGFYVLYFGVICLGAYALMHKEEGE